MTNLPEEFILQTRQLMGEERFNRYLGAFEEEAPVSIRVNPKMHRGTVPSVQVPLSTEGSLVSRRLLPLRTSSVHLRPSLPCRMLLCAGGIIDVYHPHLEKHYR